jgi:hypothetical protein
MLPPEYAGLVGCTGWGGHITHCSPLCDFGDFWRLFAVFFIRYATLFLKTPKTAYRGLK